MALDLVHDVQGAYRLLVRATAFPGSVVDLRPFLEKTDLDFGVPPVILLLGLIVLDGEVNFSIAGNPEAGAALSEITGAPLSDSAGGAPFCFVAGSDTPATEILTAAPIGTLEDPQLGATLFIETAGLSEVSASETRSSQGGDGQTGRLLALSGPGIRAECFLRVDREASWVEERRRKNSEYPLGIDLFFFDATGRVVAIPRTTQVRPL